MVIEWAVTAHAVESETKNLLLKHLLRLSIQCLIVGMKEQVLNESTALSL